MNYRTIIVSALLILMIPAMTLAQSDREDRFEFSVKTLYTTSNDYSGDGGSNLSLDESLGWGFGSSYHVNPYFDFGIAFNWRSINYKATAVDAEDPENVYVYGNRLYISTIALTGNWNMFDGPITPYLGGSIGWTIIDTNIVSGIGSGCWWDPWWGYRCGHWPVTYGENSASFTVGTGIRFQITDSLFMRAGYEYGWLSSVPVDGTSMVRIDLGFLSSRF